MFFLKWYPFTRAYMISPVISWVKLAFSTFITWFKFISISVIINLFQNLYKIPLFIMQYQCVRIYINTTRNLANFPCNFHRSSLFYRFITWFILICVIFMSFRAITNFIDHWKCNQCRRSILRYYKVFFFYSNNFIFIIFLYY